jgi:hypothetical protein
MKSFEKPTDEEVAALRPALSSPQHERYFFDRLDNPLWILPLSKAGFFAHPPEAEVLEDGRVRNMPWPQSGYLARMATLAPMEVAEIFKSIETDNRSIIRDVVKAALAMPSNFASLFVPSIGLSAENRWADLKDCADLCVKLANENHVEDALKLADHLFRLENLPGGESLNSHEDYLYIEGIKTVAPVLLQKAPGDFLAKLCAWLDIVVQAEDRNRLGRDYSDIWRPAIEDHEQNSNFGFASKLVGLVRDAFQEAIRENRIALQAGANILTSHKYSIFKRLEIHLISTFAEQESQLARRVMMQRALFDNPTFVHEYAMLMGRQFPMLNPDERKEWLRWVDDGPDISRFDKYIIQTKKREPTEEDRSPYRDEWKYNHLYWIRAHLEGDYKKFYDKMLAEKGFPKLADLNTHSERVSFGTPSPYSIDELRNLSFADAISKITSWIPNERDFPRATVEGLANTFKGYIASGLEQHSQQASVLENKPPIYVRSFIEQMADAAQQGKTIEIAKVLNLCEWVLDQPAPQAGSVHYGPGGLVDSDWDWTRSAIACFIEMVCKARIEDIPKYPVEQLRPRIMGLIKKLTDGSVGSDFVEADQEQDPRMTEYLNSAINSQRGKAIEALLEYSRWIASDNKMLDNAQETVPGGFDSMPEVREILERQIEPGNENLPAYSLIGAHVGLINWIDKRWLKQHINQIFNLSRIDTDPSVGIFDWAAWNSFLVWVQPHIDFYNLLHPQFGQMVDVLDQLSVRPRSHSAPPHRLAEHLMVLYGRGQLSLEQDEKLLRRFFKQAQPVIRRYAMEFVANSLEREKDLPPEVIARFMQLWDFYWENHARADAKDAPGSRIVGWFESGYFPDDWFLDRFGKFVEVSPRSDFYGPIFERLLRIAETDIVRTTSIVGRLVEADNEGWRIFSSFKDIKGILRVALKSGGEAREEAERIIDLLGRRGALEFGELLNV